MSPPTDIVCYDNLKETIILNFFSLFCRILCFLNKALEILPFAWGRRLLSFDDFGLSIQIMLSVDIS